ncbi:MAG: isoprenyl transferase [Clostridia bacterium]
MAKYTQQELETLGLKEETIPAHVAIIMDGNGRWAKKRGYPRSVGHRAGVDRLHGIIRLSSDIGMQALTLYAFSTENWKRPKEEVGVLMSLLIEYFNKEIDELHANGVCIRAIGDISFFPDKVYEAIEKALERTRENTGLKLNIALNYGSCAEIVHAANASMRAALDSDVHEITQQQFESFLYTSHLPQLDLLIRTGGEQRLSNFLLYQAAYAEFLFVDDFWPDFSDARYLDALRTFAARSRRFGGLEGTKT